ncbi:unnamed protein product [Spirodela intermedia]|uniref:WRKY domain-containing protein n=1 Tax=Spirodela intermedia TaxID=51605 RepID=A0A7I8IT89_SPIIN|nr:unnamed protein product [Spirodela intermedia]CAA6661015.1 unnamed protein product [Spirodela intermedia]
MGDDGGWDLQAVVKGCCGLAAAAAAAAAEDGSSSFPPPLIITEVGREEEEDWFFSFPDLCAAPADLHELEELCKPFISKTPQQQQKQNQKQSLSSPKGSSSSIAAALQLSDGRRAAAKRSPPPRAFLRTPASKRRKSQQKKVVCQVPADSLSSDLWAWRKYGQKPIKGSPFPRGYYKCSSSKGCLARKQVERSSVDPAIFIITYTAEHNHPIPTHRQKPPTSLLRRRQSRARSQHCRQLPRRRRPTAVGEQGLFLRLPAHP